MDRKLAECEGGEGGTEIQPVRWFRRLDTAAQIHQFLTLPCSFSTIHFTYLSLKSIWVCSYLSNFSVFSSLVVKSPLAIAGGVGRCRFLRREDPVLGRSTGREHGNPLQYSYLGNPMDRRARLATGGPQVRKELDTISDLACKVTFIRSGSMPQSRCRLFLFSSQSPIVLGCFLDFSFQHTLPFVCHLSL